MSKKERHVYSMQDSPDRKHAYIFNIIRDQENQEIVVESIWIVVQLHGQESKIIINLQHIAEDIWDKPHKAAPESLNKMIDEEFNELSEEVNKAVNQDLLSAAERANLQYPQSFDDIIKQINSKFNGKS